jgi:hypothetical protein
MDDIRIEGLSHAGGLEPARLKGPHQRCIYDPETICSAPRAQFQACKTCHRLNPHQAVSNLFDKIKQLASDIFNLPAGEPDQFPPQK